MTLLFEGRTNTSGNESVDQSDVSVDRSDVSVDQSDVSAASDKDQLSF